MLCWAHKWAFFQNQLMNYKGEIDTGISDRLDLIKKLHIKVEHIFGDTEFQSTLWYYIAWHLLFNFLQIVTLKQFTCFRKQF